MDKRVPARLSPAEGRSFGLTVGSAFLVLAGLLFWRDHPAGAAVTGVIGGALVLAGLAVPAHLGPVQRAWMALAVAISRITTPILMAIIYFAVFTPIGVIRRLWGRNSLVHRPAESGYWVVRGAGSKRRSDLTRQF